MQYISVCFSISSFIFLIITSLIYFLKDRVKTKETSIYSTLLISNILLLLVDIIGYFFYKQISVSMSTKEMISKIYLCIYILYGFIFTYYSTYVITKNEVFTKIIRYILIIWYTIISVIVLILPLELVNVGDMPMPKGDGVNITYALSPLIIIYLLILIFANIQKIIVTKEKRVLPILALLFFSVASIWVQFFNPSVVLVAFVYTLSTFIMYHTIENPDVKMLEKVEVAKDAAEKANRAKSDFLSSMSHEIRTPLNAIVGLSEDIGSYKDQVPEAVSEDAEDIINASQTLLEIVGNILDINKIESNKLEIVERVYEPKDAIETVAKIDSVRIGDKSIDFKVNIAEDLPYELIGDKVHIKEIVNNLLTNAIKYTEKGEINLNVRCINKGDLSNLIISVQDTGRGIKAENITKLFTKFERLDVEKNTTTEGTGLGLAITKHLVEMMHGTINVQSQFGKGSIFVVNIPQKIKTLTAPLSNEEVDEDVIIDIDNYGNKKILIVDDNTLNIKVARRALQDFNFDIEDVTSGMECLSRVTSGTKYDLILMDIMMPEMSGETTFKKLKEIQGFNTPVIALTADAVAGAEENYKGEGFVDYIAKPFKRDQIKEKLDLIFDTNAPINWDEVPVHVIGEEKEASL